MKTDTTTDPDFHLFQAYIKWKNKGSKKISEKRQQEITAGYNRYFDKYIILPAHHKKAGRPALYNEPSVPMRVPQSLVPEIKKLISEHKTKNI